MAGDRIIIKSASQIELMRRAGRITALARAYAGSLVQPGITTRELDKEVEKFIRKQGAVPSFYHLYGFKGSVCISVNDEIIHGVPGNRKLKEGDIVSIDVGACIGDYKLDRNGTPVGGCDLRIGYNRNLYYGGHIGYHVDPIHRGHHYAAKACRLLFTLAKAHGMRYLYISCNPNNVASYKTCEAAGGRLMLITPLPEHNDMRQLGELHKRIYRFEL